MRTAFGGRRELDRAADELGALPHGDQAEAAPPGPRRKPGTMILDLELERAGGDSAGAPTRDRRPSGARRC